MTRLVEAATTARPVGTLLLGSLLRQPARGSGRLSGENFSARCPIITRSLKIRQRGAASLPRGQFENRKKDSGWPVVRKLR